MSKYDFKNAPEGTTHYHPYTDMASECWVKIENGVVYFQYHSLITQPWFYWCVTGDETKVEVIRELVDINPSTKKQEWKDGIPQVSTDVGTVCEAYHAGLEGWFTVQLLYTNHPTNQDAVACMNVSNNMLFWSDTLRPIKTAEEIAAEEKAKEREEAIQQMCGHTRTSSNSLVLEAQREVCEDLYDAGYRWVKV